VAVLKDAKLLQTRSADIIIGAAVIDDVLGLLVLSFVINTPSAITFDTLIHLVKLLLISCIFIIGGILAGKKLIEHFIDRNGFTEKTFLIVMSLLLLYAYVAEYIGLSSIVGAFIAGLLLNYSKHIKEIEEKSYPLEVVFTPIFFISLGMLVDINVFGAFFIPIIVITLIAIVTKLIGCGLPSLIIGKLEKTEAMMVGFGMAPRGEVALIIALFGLTKGVLTTSEYSIISAMALLTTFAIIPVLNYLANKIKQREGEA
ncbi:MAG: cation:proton antiporter, partial [Candidatus Paceibacteria bacterium]